MIYGERVRLRATEKRDLPLFVEWLNDPDVIAGISLDLPLSLAVEEKQFQEMLARPMENHIYVIEIEINMVWTPIGNCRFHAINWTARSAEFGIMIGEKKYWRQGYGTEAVMCLLTVGFEIHNLNRIDLFVLSNNKPAIHLYEKAGFVHEGALRQAANYQGKYIDMLIMSILREEWELQV